MSESKEEANEEDFTYDKYDRKTHGEVLGCNKFFLDLKAAIVKRFYQLIRDFKTFILEIFCPIILVLIGLGVTSVTFQQSSPPKEFSLGLIGINQNITINTVPLISSNSFDIRSAFSPKENEVYNFVDIDSSKYLNSSSPTVNYIQAFVDYNNMLFLNGNTNSLAGYFITRADTVNQLYEGAIFVNTVAREGAPIFLNHFFQKVISAAANRQIEIHVRFDNISATMSHFLLLTSKSLVTR